VEPAASSAAGNPAAGPNISRPRATTAQIKAAPASADGRRTSTLVVAGSTGRMVSQTSK
jgi:hypothetical protein